MNKILDLMHKLCRFVITITAFICIDIPVKLLLCLIFLILGFIVAISYPIWKNLEGPEWISNIYDYATNFKCSLAKQVYTAWS